MSSLEELIDRESPVFSKAVQLDGAFLRLVEEIKGAEIHLPSKPIIISGSIDPDQNNTNFVITLIEDNYSKKQLNLKKEKKILK